MQQNRYEQKLKEQEELICQLRRDREYWRHHYNTVLNAYFELHSSYNQLTEPKNELGSKLTIN